MSEQTEKALKPSYHVFEAKMDYDEAEIHVRVFESLDAIYTWIVENGKSRYDLEIVRGTEVNLDNTYLDKLYEEKDQRDEAERKARKEVAERATYERLKAKFEGGEA